MDARGIKGKLEDVAPDKIFMTRVEFADVWGCSPDHAGRLLKKWGVDKSCGRYFVPDIARAIAARREV